MTPRRLALTVAVSSYDHVSELVHGTVEIAGVDPLFVDLPIPEMFRRYRDWDVAEMSAAKYVSLRASGKDAVLALPVFTSRLFRHSSIYVRRDRVTSPTDLKGARLGTPAWNMTAGVYARGLLADMYDVQPWDVEWVQGGLDRPGRTEAVPPPALPASVSFTSVQDRSLEEMLWAGDIEGIVTPAVPPSLQHSAAAGGVVGLLFDDCSAAEHAYFDATGIFPVMHLVVIRRGLTESYPWLASNVYRAFEIAKRRYFRRLVDISASRAPLPWVGDHLATLRRLFDGEPWPYGVTANRRTLDGLVRYAGQQGLLETAVNVDDLFLPIEPFVDSDT